MSENNSGQNGQGGSSGTPGTPPAGDDISKRLTLLEEQLKSEKTKNETLAENLSRTNALLEAAWDPNATGTKGEPDPNSRRTDIGRDYAAMGIPNDAAAELIKEAEERAFKRMTSEQQRQRDWETTRNRAQNKFYTDNPDLKSNEIIVQHFANEVQREHPRMTTEQAMVEVAKRSREYVVQKFPPSGSNPPNVLPGNNNGGDRGSSRSR